MLKSLCRLIFSLLLVATGYFIFATPSSAQEEFNTRFTSTYTVSEEGITTVEHLIELTNKLANVYASEYSLTIGSTRVKNVSAIASSGTSTTSVSTDDNTTSININFTDPAIGKDQTLRFTVSYLNLDIATKNGRVLEVNIPRLANIADLDEYNLLIKVPDSFDQPTIISPQTTSITKSQGQRIIRYSKRQIGSRGISILFGDHQVYDFTLRYTLKNPGITNGSVEIAIPPDTPYQKLFYQSITPTPENVVVDQDGNWLARYTLRPSETLQVSSIGQAVLYLKPVVETPPTIDTSRYLGAQKYWPVSDPAIKSLAQKLKTPENIYNYIVENLNYNYDRIDASTTQRLGAKAALDDPQNAICTEFTDLFVALTRAAGIPARSQDGFAFTTNSKLRPLSLRVDVLHAWPEYYDTATNRWVPVDPTWGNTTQGIDYFSRWDLNHFTFTIHGQDSVTPYPAGAYKLASTQGKDVNVAFSPNEPSEKRDIEVDFTTPKLALPALPQEVKINLSNTGNVALVNLPISLRASGYNILGSADSSLAVLPPKSSTTLSVKLKQKNLLPSASSLTATINDHEYIYALAENKFGPTQAILSVVALGLAGLVAILAKRAGRLLVQRQKRRASLHRQSQEPQK